MDLRYVAAWPKIVLFLGLGLGAVPVTAGSIVYVQTTNQEFGTMDLGTGLFTQIGTGLTEGSSGLVPGPNSRLLTLGFTGNLDSINPATGVETVIGPTGLTDCSIPSSPCGPKSANSLAEVGGSLYASDFQGNLYKVNPTTGAATLIGLTGMPPVTFVPLGAPNPDGSLNFFGGTLFGANGLLYATFDTGTENPMTGVPTPVLPDNLYQINTSTGKATVIAPTAFSLDAFAQINGTTYGFENATGQLVSLNLANGNTTTVGTFDQSAGLVLGATPVPEPTSLGFAVIGIAAIGGRRIRRSLSYWSQKLVSIQRTGV